VIVITGRIRVQPSELDALLRSASEVASASRQERGCGAYSFSVDIDDPLVVRLLEEWESDGALEAHFSTKHFQRFAESLVGSADGPSEFTRYEVSSVAPLFG
jgi:quinol monooxygenase YgiN